MRGVFGAFAVAMALAGFTVGGISSASAQFRISDDRGGQIGPYLQQFAMVRDSGSRVVIDGICLSACTLVLGTVPKDRICVTSRANLGFHAAWNPTANGHAAYSDEGTRLLWEVYPAHIRNWIKRKGGLTPRMIFLKGKELAAMYPACPSAERYAEAAPDNRPSQPASNAGGAALAAATR